jgi:FAD/FMN-containing dehydrogenase
MQDGIKAMDYTRVQRMNDSTDTRGIASYLKGGFIGKGSPELVSALVDGLQGDPRRMTVLFFQHCGGASSRVAESSTAFAHRYALANMMTVAAWPINASADDTKAHIEATRRYWKTLEPHTRGFYTNDAIEESQQQIDDNYAANLPRLVALKNRYDPTNLFRLNANIVPSA